MLRVVLAVLTLAAPVAAQQSETLADIRQDIAILNGELARLKQELNTTGASTVQVSGSVLERVNAIEAELTRITAKTERLSFRIDAIVRDGSNRLGDLEFRLCEALDGCDIGTLGQTAPLGGEALPPVLPAGGLAGAADGGSDALPAHEGELAVSEEADFSAAQTALAEGDFAAAADAFARFREIYPMGPLEAAALVGEGRALEGAGDTREAARRYLSAYSGFPEASVAPEALFLLGAALGTLGSVAEACVTLSEVGNRYPVSDFAARAEERRLALGCQ